MGITAQNALEKLAKNLAYYATETALNELLQELSIDAAPPHKHGSGQGAMSKLCPPDQTQITNYQTAARNSNLRRRETI